MIGSNKKTEKGEPGPILISLEPIIKSHNSVIRKTELIRIAEAILIS